MMQPMNNPAMLLMGAMRQGADIFTALNQVAQQHPQIFPPDRVNMARAMLSNGNRQQLVANMARERGIDLNQYMTQLQQMAQTMGFR